MPGEGSHSPRAKAQPCGSCFPTFTVGELGRLLWFCNGELSRVSLSVLLAMLLDVLAAQEKTVG